MRSVTNEIPELFGDFQLSEYGVSFIADNVILLRYVEVGGRMEHAISIMKVRGSRHSRDIRRFEITENGIRIGGTFDRMSGILTGIPSMSDDSRYFHLPLRSRYVCDALRQVGLATIEKLSQVTGLSEDDVRCEFQHLQKRGLVEAAPDEEGTEFFELCS